MKLKHLSAGPSANIQQVEEDEEEEELIVESPSCGGHLVSKLMSWIL